MAFHHSSRNGPQVDMPPFFNAFPVNGNDLATLFQLFNGENNNENERLATPNRQAGRSYRAPVAAVINPRFDIRDDKESYHVSGELPGLEQKDINIEFTDDSTLLISGRTMVHEYPHAYDGLAIAAAADKPEQKPTASRRASVEDVDDNGDNAVQSSQNVTVVATVEKNEPSQSQSQHQHQHQQKPHYLIRERSFGDFRRSFTFPNKVNQDAVKASLRNGVLNITVPKAVASRRTITIE